MKVYHSCFILYYKYPTYGSFSPINMSSSFIPNMLKKLLLRNYHVQGTVIDTGHTVVSKIYRHGPCPHGA